MKGLIAIALGLIIATAVLVVSGQEQRLPCNAEGDVRYIGDDRYVCERTSRDGLRWTWSFQGLR